MTIHEARKDLQNNLTAIYDAGEAANIAELVIENITELSRNDRISDKNKQIALSQAEKLEKIQQRLLLHEPVQYVLNEAWFCGMKFYIDKNVLIPRPETEELVEWVISNLRFPFNELKILDIGSGSGCIAIALKRKLRKAEVWSCDISAEAIEVAKRNAENLNADVKFIQLNFLSANELNILPVFDIIISNPPYVPEKDKQQMNRNVLEYEPHTALFVPDNDPLIFYKSILNFSERHLNKNGNIFLELHEDFAKATANVYLSEHFLIEIKKDMQGKERLLKVSR